MKSSNSATLGRLFSAALVLLPLALPSTKGRAEEGYAFFENEVRPILVARCYECHSEEAGKQKGSLWLDRKAGWQNGGDAGPSLVPGDVEASLLVHTIRYQDPALQMPPKTKLPSEEIAVLERWVAMGAPDPRDEALAGALRGKEIDFEEARRNWAFRPVQDVEIPSVENKAWSDHPVDAFLLAALEQKSLEPVEDAAPAAFLRRLHHDLTGLPPTPQEVAAYEADPSPEALATVIDELLSRPAFGQRWGRHWLDVARYADSNGGDRNFTFHHAWRYRDYVIDSFNRDRSYYEFVRQQLAGDLMSAASDEERADQLVASTFLALGPKMLTERDKEKLRLDTADEQLDTIGRSLLGLTLGCARCHDHKFDPVSQKDYYAVAGILRSTQVVMGTRNGCVNVASWVEQALPGAEEGEAELAAKVERLELAMRLVVEKSFMKKAGGKMSLDALPLAGVIYDEADAELIGEWKESTYSDNRFGKHYIHDDRAGKGEKKVIFRGSLPENGIYEVRVAYNADNRRAKAVPVTVEGWRETKKVTLDQTKAPEIGGLFQPIGKFRFEKGGRVNVIIETAGTEGYVIVDAVQFVHESDIEREAMAIAAMEDDGDALFRMGEGDLKKEISKLLKEMRKADLAMAPRDAHDAGDIHLRVRGEVGQLGPKVERNFLQVLHKGAPPEIADGQSGRMEFAAWITSEDNALLDRVMVNRVWHHLFGQGLVSTVDNFGKLGSGPSHPELLDYLAIHFRENGGSVKELIRFVATSRAYRLGADATESLFMADPENRLVGHQNRRRLSAEEIRDSVLFLAGRLDASVPDGPVVEYGEDLDKGSNLSKHTVRTVYLPVARNNLAAELELFDVAHPDLVSGARAETTVPTQALYLMNSGFYAEQAGAIAKRVIGEAAEAVGEGESVAPAQAIEWLYRLVLNRAPRPDESERAQAFLSELQNSGSAKMTLEQSLRELAHLMIVSTEFLYLD